MAFGIWSGLCNGLASAMAKLTLLTNGLFRYFSKQQRVSFEALLHTNFFFLMSTFFREPKKWRNHQLDRIWYQSKDLLKVYHCILQISPRVFRSIQGHLSKLVFCWIEDQMSFLIQFRLQKPRNKPLLVVFGWMVAKAEHIQVYTNPYIDQGYDALVISKCAMSSG